MMMSHSWRQNLLVVWISQFMSMLSFSSSYTFIPFYFETIGVQASELGMYVALFSAAGNFTFCVFAPIWGMLADVYGRRVMLIRANLGAALLLPMMPLIPRPEWVLLLRLLMGMLTGTVTAAQILVLDTTPRERRSFALGTLVSAVFGGSMAGQFLGGYFVDAFGFTATFIWSGVLMFISAILVTLFSWENFHGGVSLRQRLSGVSWHLPRLGKAWYLMLLFVYLGFAREFDNPFVPLLVKDVMHNSPAALRWTGWINGACSISGVLAGFIIGALALRIKLVRLMMVIFVVAGVMRIVQVTAPDEMTLLVERMLMVLAAGGIEPLFQTWLAGITPEERHGSFFGWAACAKASGWIIGSLCGGFTILLCGGVRGVFVASGIMFFIMAFLAKLVAARTPPPEYKSRRRA